MMDLEFDTKNIALVAPQAIAAAATTAQARIVESKGARAVKIRVLARGVASGKVVTFVLKGGDTHSAVSTTISTVAPVANSSGIIDATYYVKEQVSLYPFLTGEATAAADAGATVVASVDLELTGLRESTNLTETPELYS